MGKKENIGLDDLSKLIIDCINEEPFFRKEVLIPKVRALMAGFRLNVNSTNYERIERKSEKERRLRTLEQREAQIVFWKDIVKKLSSSDEMECYYGQQEKMLINGGFKKKINSNE